MATVYAPPKHIVRPDIKDFLDDYEGLNKAEEEYAKSVIEYCKSNSNCPHAGEEISFGVADGCARYVVFNYRTLIFLEIEDAYQIPDAHARGLRKADIVSKIERRKAFSEAVHLQKQKNAH